MEANNNKAWLVGLAVIGVVALGMWALSPTEVVVSGIGTVSVPASSTSFNVTIVASSDSANQALIELRSKVASIRQTMGDAGIAPDTITESQVSITPLAMSDPKASGYQALTNLSVKTNSVATVGELIVILYAKGATVVSQPVVSVSDEMELEQQALNKALDEAQARLNETIGWWRVLRRKVKIEQASSGSVATNTANLEGGSSFEVVKAVNVTYRVW